LDPPARKYNNQKATSHFDNIYALPYFHGRLIHNHLINLKDRHSLLVFIKVISTTFTENVITQIRKISIGEIMKKSLIGLGIFLLIVGIVVMACSLISVQYTTTKPVEVEKSDYWLRESFVVPAGTHTARYGSLSAGTRMRIYVKVTSGGNLDVNFHVMDETNYWKWRAGESASTSITRSRITTFDDYWTVSSSETWYFVFDNSFSWITSKGVTCEITHYWTETEYKQVTEYRTLISSEYSYIGVILLLVGIAVLISGIVSTPIKYASKQIKSTVLSPES